MSLSDLKCSPKSQKKIFKKIPVTGNCYNFFVFQPILIKNWLEKDIFLKRSFPGSFSQSSDRYPVRRFGGKIRECSCLSKLFLRKVLRHSPSRMPLPFELRKSQLKIVGECSGLSQSSEHWAFPTKNNMCGYRNRNDIELWEIIMQARLRCYFLVKRGWPRKVRLHTFFHIFTLLEFIFFISEIFESSSREGMKNQVIRKTPRKWTLQKEICFQSKFYQNLLKNKKVLAFSGYRNFF